MHVLLMGRGWLGLNTLSILIRTARILLRAVFSSGAIIGLEAHEQRSYTIPPPLPDFIFKYSQIISGSFIRILIGAHAWRVGRDVYIERACTRVQWCTYFVSNMVHLIMFYRWGYY